MKICLVVTFLAMLIGHVEPIHASAHADFYVSPDGSDRWSGTLPEPNAAKTDGPFATLAQARDAVQAHPGRAAAQNMLVLLRGGTYRIQETVVFGRQDSGLKDATVTYGAYPDEVPVLSSGAPIAQWERLGHPIEGLSQEAVKHVWVADLSPNDQIPQRFFTLYDAEGLLPRARSAGFIPISGTAGQGRPKDPQKKETGPPSET